jgi:flagellar biogenesis protein FliO
VLVALALLLVAALIVVIAWILQRVGGRRFGLLGSRSRAPRLGVVDAMPIDSRRRLVLVRRDNVEHLLLIGGGADLVIEQAIQRSATAAQRGRQAAPAARETLPAPPAGPMAQPTRQGPPAEPQRPPQAAPRPAPRIPPPPPITPTPLPPAAGRPAAPAAPPLPVRPAANAASPTPRPPVDEARPEAAANDADPADRSGWPFERGEATGDPPDAERAAATVSEMAPDDDRPRSGPAVDHEMARLLGEIAGRS